MEDTLQFELTGLNGIKRKYTIIPMQRGEALYVFDTFVRGFIASAGVGLVEAQKVVQSQGGIFKTDIQSLISALGPAVKTVDYDQLRKCASLMLTKAVIMSDGSEPIWRGGCNAVLEDFETVGLDYYRDNPWELYVAVLLAINANWPDVFSDARAKINVLRHGIETALRGLIGLNGQCRTDSSSNSGSNKNGALDPGNL